MANNHTMWAIAIYKKKNNPESANIKQSIFNLNILNPNKIKNSLMRIDIVYIYYLLSDLKQTDVRKIANEFIFDPIADEKIDFCKVNDDTKIPMSKADNGQTIEIVYKPGVMDPTAEFIKEHLNELGFTNVTIKTAKRYLFIGNLDKKTVATIAENLLFNPLIQEIALDIKTINETKPSRSTAWKLHYIDMLNMSDNELVELSKSRLLALSLPEMKAIQKYYQKLNRNPTDIELETFAQTWSEHCKHKTFKADIICDDGKKQYRIKSLFDTYIKKVTKELNKNWCLSVFEDNAGIIEFDKQYGIAFKVETHNHPSALEPYGGAATGIGGVIRDCLGCGLGAKPICNTDVFCFPPPNLARQQLPKGVLHPRRIIEGVTLGVRDYGNRMGIPTTNGAINFHPGFVCNPYVYCGTVGIIPKTKIKKKIRPGDFIVLIGGKTGRDGIHGVTFASLELDKDTKQISSQAVQIGNPIEEKKVLDLMLQARDLNLYNATTDCGGGGLSSAIGELAKTGAIVHLEKVPLKYAGLSYTEIWISESQERMVLFVSRKNIKKLLTLAKIHNVDASVIGKVTNTKRLQLKYHNKEVGNIDLNFLHNGLPKLMLSAKIVTNGKSKTANSHNAIKQPKPDYNQKILQLLSSHNVASKEWVVRQYDFEVQGKTIIKPFIGIKKVTPSDGCVLQPLPDSKKGIIITCGIAVEYHQSPYWMSASAIDEAIRNAVALGADPNRIALLDNFCWASPEDAKILGDLVLACQACYDIAKQYQTPFISGKDSLYNEYQGPDGKKIIPPSALLISAISVIDDIDQTVTTDFKAVNELIYIVGQTLPELDVPKVFPKYAKKTFQAMHQAIKTKIVSACHDISSEGMAITLAEMTFANSIGAEIFLTNSLDTDSWLFSKSNSRFICSVPAANQKQFESLMKEIPFTLIGKTYDNGRLKIYDDQNQPIINLDINQLFNAWQQSP